MTELVVFVVGKAASGKTTLCRSLTDDFSYMSASAFLNQMRGDLRSGQGRFALAEQGREMRASAELARFHGNLTEELLKHRRVVIDGVRFRETIDAVGSQADRSLLVYIDCPEAVRRKRLEAGGRGLDWAWLERHPTEISVDEMREAADVVLDGALAPEVIRRKLVLATS